MVVSGKEIEVVRTKHPRVTKKGLQILHKIFCGKSLSSESSGLSDVIFIAIDFEHLDNIETGFAQGSNCQVGLAILDTKDINADQVSPDKLISTYNFSTGSLKYHTKASKKFMFGETVRLCTSEIADHIQSLIPSSRNTVFVGHGVKSDIKALQSLNFQFPALLSAIIDTRQVANQVFGTFSRSLMGLLQRVECPFNRLHSAGNDANFTLRALLLLAVRGLAHRQPDMEGGSCNTLAILQQISSCPLPRWVNPELIAARKKQKRIEKRKVHQAKARDEERQDQVRAFRKQKREDVVAYKERYFTSTLFTEIETIVGQAASICLDSTIVR
ncbi:hypothetical protein MMC10_004966 [Thelotrema lepadinum]|nr:hypothetical protein [Thelotrema lepadinum]